MKIILQDSKAKNKRYAAVIKYDDNRKKTYNFGDIRYENFLIHQDPERQKKYKLRHQNDLLTEIGPAALSWYILWNKPTLSDSIADFEEKFNVQIENNIKN